MGPMRTFSDAILNFLKAEDGPTAVEYAVMLALIVVVCITAITALGSNAKAVFNNVALNTAVNSGS
jgi:pilus assembly protein Flp/PilA